MEAVRFMNEYGRVHKRGQVKMEPIEEPLVVTWSNEDAELVGNLEGFDAVELPPTARDGRDPHHDWIKRNDTQCKFEQRQQVILAFPPSDVSFAIGQRIAEKIGPMRCARSVWPTEQGDNPFPSLLAFHAAMLDDGMGNERADAELDRILFHSKPFPVEGLIRPSDMLEELLWSYDHMPMKGRSTGIAPLDELYSVIDGKFTVITGVPGSGKSQMMLHSLLEMAKLHGDRSVIFTAESNPLYRYTQRVCQIIQKKSFLPNPFGDRMTKAEVREAVEFADQHMTFIAPEQSGTMGYGAYTLDNLLSIADAELFRRGVKHFVIDPFNYLARTKKPNEDNNQVYATLLMSLRQWGAENGVSTWLIAHPRKAEVHQSGEFKGQYKIPGPYDIANSSELYNGPDGIIAVGRHRDVETGKMLSFGQFNVDKVRDEEIVGETGIAPYYYDSGTYEYYCREDMDVQPAPIPDSPFRNSQEVPQDSLGLDMVENTTPTMYGDE